MGRARLNKGTKKRVITSVERQIVCFSVGSPLQRHLPTTKWAVHPNSSANQFFCKVTKSRNNHKVQSQKHFFSSKFIRTIRQHFTPTRAKNSSTISQKQRHSQQNSTALFTDAPADLTSYSSPPSSAPMRAPTRTQRVFVFCLHPSPPEISHSFLAS